MTEAALQEMLKEPLSEKEKTTTRKHENYKQKKLTGKGKHIVKVGNHSLIKLVGRLKDKSSKIIYIHIKQLRERQNNQM